MMLFYISIVNDKILLTDHFGIMKEIEFKTIILNCGMDDKEIADLLKVSKITVNRWRTGKNEPHINVVKDIVEKIMQKQGQNKGK